MFFKCEKVIKFRSLIIGVLLIFPTGIFALEYIESSNGLSVPEWEGGHTELEMVDMNLDGNIDILSIGDHGSPYINTDEHGVMVYFGNGSGIWNVFQNGNFGYGGIAIGDCNGDGFLDIGYGMHHNYSGDDFGDQLIEVALGNGTGQNWQPWDDGLASHGETYGMFSTDFGDIDNDGDLDIASTSFGYGNDLMIYRNRLDGTWEFADNIAGGNCNMIVQFGDINRDGNIDVATAYQNGTVYFGSGTGTFVNADHNLPIPGSMGYYGVSLGDVDNDGGMDLSFIQNGVQVWIWDEASSTWINYSGALTSITYGTYSQLCDMNMDGFCDIVVGGGGRVSVWSGDGAGNWTLEDDYVIQNDPDCPFEFLRAGGDIDHNGYPDIVHLTDEGSWINSYNHLRCYKESSTGDELQIFPTFPKGGEVFLGGSVKFIDWITEVPRGETAVMDIEFSSTGLTGPWQTVTTSFSNGGRYQWTVPDDVNSDDCYFRFTLTSLTGTEQTTTPAAFSIYRLQDLASIDIEPVLTPIVIPASGGSFSYEVNIANLSDISCSFDAWIDAVMPNGSTTGPLLLKQGITIGAMGSVFRTMNQNVPAIAPPGNYTYQAHIGCFANDFVWSEDSFPFEKSAAGSINPGASGWELTGWGNMQNDLLSEIEQPADFRILNSHPNPFNPATEITFNLSESGHVNLSVYDVQGRKIAELFDGFHPGGSQKCSFDGARLSSGIYFAVLTTENVVKTQKLVLVK